MIPAKTAYVKGSTQKFTVDWYSEWFNHKKGILSSNVIVFRKAYSFLMIVIPEAKK